MIATSARPTSQTPPMSSLRSGWLAPRGSERIANGSAMRPSRHVDEEDQPPADAPQVGVDERAGEHRRAEHGQARRRAEQAGGPAELLVVEDLLQQAEALRDHQGAEAALQGPEGDEHAHVRRHGAGGREAGEAERGRAGTSGGGRRCRPAGPRRSAARRRPGCTRRSATGSCWLRRRARGGSTGRRRSRWWRRAGPWCWRPARRPPRSSAGRKPAPGRRRCWWREERCPWRPPWSAGGSEPAGPLCANSVCYERCSLRTLYSCRGVRVNPDRPGVAGLGGPRHEGHRAGPARLATARPRRR